MIRDPILSAFEALAARQPEQPLVVSPDASATARDVDDQSRVAAEQLLAEDQPDGALVGLAAPNGVGFLAGLLATRRAGVGVVLLDPTTPARELRRTAAALGAGRLLTAANAWPSGLADWRLETLEGASRLEPAAVLPPRPIVKVTSGSTGAPRGVWATADNLCADESALHTTMGLRDDERILAAIPMGFSYGLASIALPALLRGSVVVVPAPAGPLAPLVAARDARASFFPTVPAYLQGLARLERREVWPDTLRLVVSAGAPLSAATASRFREIYGLPVHSFYGASECGGICYDREGGAAERHTVGPPVEGVRLSLEPLGGDTGDEGTVTVESESVAVGYVPEADDHLAGGRFRASDRARWVRGELQLCGRVDRQINVRGRKVDPAEVEGVLSQLEKVLEVVVVGIPSADDGGQTIRAVVACRPGAVTTEAVLGLCRDRLADHKVPRSVRLVSEVPRTPRGKVDYDALLTMDDAESRSAN